MKRVALLLTLVLTLALLASCGHVHTYDEKWSSDASGHWHNATCDCEDADVNKAAHVDKNNDNVCDYCEFTDHTHTYSDKWTADESAHWKGATCGCTVAGQEKANHTDTNGDGECDVCKYVIEDNHSHIFSDDWSYDDKNHWHAAICEHTSEQADKEAHNLDNAGYCTVCDAKLVDVDDADIAKVLAAAVARDHMVVSGNVAYQNYIYTGTMSNLVVSSSLINNVYYVLGNGQSYINYASVNNGVETPEQQWFELLDNGDIIAAVSRDGGLTMVYESGAPEHLNGYNYTPSGILASFENTYTLAQTLYSLYTLSESSNAIGATSSVNKGVYSFSFDYYVVNAISGGEVSGTDDDNAETTVSYNTAYYTVTATFTCDSNGVINYADFTVDAFQQGEGTLNDLDYTYDPGTNKFNFTANKNPDRYHYEVTQISGERVYNSNYPFSSFVPHDFDLKYNGKLVGSSISAKQGQTFYLDLANLDPIHSNPELLRFLLAADVDDFKNSAILAIKTNDDGTEDVRYGWFNPSTNQIGFNLNKKGEWKVTIDAFDKEFTVFVGAVSPTSIQAHVFYENSGWGDTWLEVSDAEGSQSAVNSASVKVGEELLFTALISPTVCDQSFTVTCSNSKVTIGTDELTSGMVFSESLSEGIDGDPLNPRVTYTAYTFSASATGTYTVTITSVEDPTITTTLTVTVTR